MTMAKTQPDPILAFSDFAALITPSDKAAIRGRLQGAAKGIDVARTRAAWKKLLTAAKNTPILPGTGDPGFALDHHQNDLAVAYQFGGGVARFQPIKREAYIAPTGTFWGDLVHLTAVAEGFSEEVSHGSHFSIVRPERPQISVIWSKPSLEYFNGGALAGSCSASTTIQP